jgi:hypothetical protein
MNYNFFSDKTDKIRLLQFVFDETDLQIFDSSSAYGATICEYKNAKDIADKFDLEMGGQFAVTLTLWSPRFSEKVLFERVNLDPKHCEGQTWRYTTTGLGLIQLYLGGIEKNTLNYSHIGHQSEKRAALWHDTVSQGDRASKWDWKEIAGTSRKLRSVIHNKWAVDKIGSLGIMSGAKELEKQGLRMSYFIR